MFLGLNVKGEGVLFIVFIEVEGVEKNWFYGKYLVGNVGI